MTNTGSMLWPGGDRCHPLIRLGVGWKPVNGGPLHEVGRALLPHALAPGESTRMPVSVCSPPLRGPAELAIDLVHEDVRWFGCAFTARVEVEPSASERIATLADHHGALIPLDTVWAVRRGVAVRDGLRQPRGSLIPSDSRMAQLTLSFPTAQRRPGAVMLDRVSELHSVLPQPNLITEFGSGSSTAIIAGFLAEQCQACTLLSFEYDPVWAERARAMLADRGLERTATVIALQGVGPGHRLGDALPGEAERALRRTGPRLIVVYGGFPGAGAWLPEIPRLMAPFGRDDVRLLMDNVFSDLGLCAASAWEGCDQVVVHGVRPAENGLLEATLLGHRRWGRRRRSDGIPEQDRVDVRGAPAVEPPPRRVQSGASGSPLGTMSTE